MNSFIGKGRITNDLELKGEGDTQSLRFGIAIRRDYKNKDGDYDTDFFNCIAFGRTAKFISDYFEKGKEILLSGHLQNNQYTTESGEKRSNTNIVIEKVEFCGSTEKKKENPETIATEVIETSLSDDDLPF